MPTTDQPQPGDFVIWLLTKLSSGEKLTATKALNRALVRAAVDERPSWYKRELFGEPNREFDVPVLEQLHELILWFKLARRYKGTLVLSPAGRKLLSDLLMDPDDEAATSFCAYVLYEVLTAIGSGSLDEFLAVTACKVGASGHQISFREHVDIAVNQATLAGLIAPADEIARWRYAGPVREILALMKALDLCREEATDDLRRQIYVFSDAGRAVIRRAGITGTARILDA